jgi:predicted nicotinamide N-methyase
VYHIHSRYFKYVDTDQFSEDLGDQSHKTHPCPSHEGIKNFDGCRRELMNLSISVVSLVHAPNPQNTTTTLKTESGIISICSKPSVTNIMSSNPTPLPPNRPRNFLVTDATKPFEFQYIQYGKPVSIVVNQTAEEETWPGGALWDIGVLLSQYLVALAGYQNTTTGGVANQIRAPKRLLEAVPSIKDLTVLELGCGVGLTGIVAAAALGTQLTILTDLDEVVKQVTHPNVEQNSSPSSNKQQPFRLTSAGKRGHIMAMPLCWGDEQDEKAVAECFLKWTRIPKSPRTSHKDAVTNKKDTSKPDLIIIGDVAYQHKPGAPSHFDILLSTVLKFLGSHTIVIFGTRMRMPASADLLDMFLVHMEDVTTPPISADEINPSFNKFKHQITVHVLRKKSREGST